MWLGGQPSVAYLFLIAVLLWSFLHRDSSQRHWLGLYRVGGNCITFPHHFLYTRLSRWPKESLGDRQWTPINHFYSFLSQRQELHTCFSRIFTDSRSECLLYFNFNRHSPSIYTNNSMPPTQGFYWPIWIFVRHFDVPDHSLTKTIKCQTTGRYNIFNSWKNVRRLPFGFKAHCAHDRQGRSWSAWLRDTI